MGWEAMEEIGKRNVINKIVTNLNVQRESGS